MKKIIIATLAGAAILSACTHTEKVTVAQLSDKKMSCEDIENEFAELDNVMNEAKRNKGVNTANVAAALFFWPAAVGNYMDAKDAEELVEDRRTHLNKIYEQKGC